VAERTYPTHTELHAMKDALMLRAFANHDTNERECRLSYTVAAEITRYERQRATVKAKMESTIARLQRELAILDKSDLDYIGVNTLGVLQGEGPALDRECAVLGECAQSLRTMLSLVK
jgi:hypothetical protein